MAFARPFQIERAGQFGDGRRPEKTALLEFAIAERVRPGPVTSSAPPAGYNRPGNTRKRRNVHGLSGLSPLTAGLERNFL